MGFALEPGEELPRGLRRILRERIDEAIAALSRGGRRGARERIHRARKRFKEVRAALRLVRPAIGDGRFRGENRAYRDVSRPLSAVRDSAALIDALAALVEHFRPELSRRAFESARRALEKRDRELAHRTIVEQNALRRAADASRRHRRRLDHLPLAKLDEAALVEGIRSTYGAGRRAMRSAFGEASDENLHEWRKQAKYLRHQARILSPVFPEMMELFEEQGKRLADLLGDDHDLAVMKELADDDLAGVDRHERHALDGLIADRRATLQKKARRIGRKLYAEKPKAFARRIEEYLRASA